MKLTHYLWRRRQHARVAQDIKKVPFREYLPLSLKDSVQGAARKSSEQNCLYEMTLLFTCLNDSNFENQLCGNQIKSLQECMKNYTEHMEEQKVARKLEVPKPNAKTFTNTQVTYLLHKYPNV
ncbi:PREDICTED: uncharacterized protein LOC107185896 [Dufourea novaeangliae]|uniref:CHCH domain-containing protein n=1 Tax=Dufourea novaeangliae TaxID=178035 RepID=A0A154P8S6_DUFNO|nr:PREDICTED: uncharacterized protein LOC107185896 [Dufourea novaeangliae]KZC07618.1 hypothetical protein WN55_08390 [Dufourea novaeangliae]